MLIVIFVLSYVAMAWYDYKYNCDTKMYSGKNLGANTIDAIFKPQRRNEDIEKKKQFKIRGGDITGVGVGRKIEWTPEQTANYKKWIKLYSLEDKQTLMRSVDPEVVARVAQDILSVVPVEDWLKKNQD